MQKGKRQEARGKRQRQKARGKETNARGKRQMQEARDKCKRQGGPPRLVASSLLAGPKFAGK